MDAGARRPELQELRAGACADAEDLSAGLATGDAGSPCRRPGVRAGAVLGRAAGLLRGDDRAIPGLPGGSPGRPLRRWLVAAATGSGAARPLPPVRGADDLAHDKSSGSRGPRALPDGAGLVGTARAGGGALALTGCSDRLSYCAAASLAGVAGAGSS